MRIRMLCESAAVAFRALRRSRLEEDPRAFAESVEEHDSISLETIAARLRHSSGENFVVGAFDGDQLVGMAGFSRNLRRKSRHKGTIWGVYVRATARGKGAGRA